MSTRFLIVILFLILMDQIESNVQFNITASLSDASKIDISVDPKTSIHDLKNAVFIAQKRKVEIVTMHRLPCPSPFNHSMAIQIKHEIDNYWFAHQQFIEIYVLMLHKLLNDASFYKVRLIKYNKRLRAEFYTFDYRECIDLGNSMIDKFADLLKRVTETTQEFETSLCYLNGT